MEALAVACPSLARSVKTSDFAAAKRVVRLLVEFGIRPRDETVILDRRVVAIPRGREHAVIERSRVDPSVSRKRGESRRAGEYRGGKVEAKQMTK